MMSTCVDINSFNMVNMKFYLSNYRENGKLVGQSVDLVKAVCKFAGRKCKTSVVQRSQCWDNSQGFPPFSLGRNTVCCTF